jgi:hypothetical protein
MLLYGQCPASLEVIDRTDDSIRLRIEQVGTTRAMVIDLPPAKVDELIAELTELRKGMP